MLALRMTGFVLGLLIVTGCEKKDVLYDVSGTVTYDGKDVPMGMVYFDPDPTQGGKGTQGFATVKDGKFDTTVGGRGVMGGPYVIRVAVHDGKAGNENPWGKPLRDEYTFKKELPKANSELPIEVPK